MESLAKGTVTPLASMLSEEEARKAAKRVEEKVGEKRKEMNRLEQFVADNANLINLVKKLPDQLHHDIMVPFGKMAFFPGRLIHTNEFLVLLGENYYVERTSKQTVDVLKRREKTLTSHVDSLKAEIKDLRTEASFFSATASEAAEGLVEIREEYVEETSSGSAPELGKQEPSGLPGRGNSKDEVKDDEFARMIARLDELEMEELRGEKENDRDEEEDSDAESAEESENDVDEEFTQMMSKLDELERKELTGEMDKKGVEDEESDAESDSDVEEEEETRAIPEKVSGCSSSNHESRYAENFGSFEPPRQPRDRNASADVLPEKHQHHKDSVDQLNCTGLMVQHFPKEDTSRYGISPKNVGTSRSILRAPVVSEAKAETNIIGPQKNKSTYGLDVESPVQKPKPEFDSSKAFTGSIVEHAHNLEPETQGQVQPTGSQPSKLVSRFRSQRR